MTYLSMYSTGTFVSINTHECLVYSSIYDIGTFVSINAHKRLARSFSNSILKIANKKTLKFLN